MYDGVAYDLTTFPLRLRDMRLSLITPSTFLQAFAPAEILVVTKAIGRASLARENEAGGSWGQVHILHVNI